MSLEAILNLFGGWNIQFCKPGSLVGIQGFTVELRYKRLQRRGPGTNQEYRMLAFMNS